VTLRVLSVFGTRPEAIKMAPVVLRLAADPRFEARVCVTGQHRQMLDQVLLFFGITPDFDLNVMSPGQDLHELTAKVLLGMRGVLRSERPDVTLVHGDTTTCLVAALASFYEGVPVGHVEAGLRSGNPRRPFPEEMNRVLAGRLATLHFAPTSRALDNLVSEGVDRGSIHVTGNTVIDALRLASSRVAGLGPQNFRDELGLGLARTLGAWKGRVVLVTGHRRESFGKGIAELCGAIRDAAHAHADWLFIYPVHLNPSVQRPVHEILGGLENVALIEPLGYGPFVWLMGRADAILTDSGGIQEEAPALGTPVLVTRDVTERPEAIDAGSARLVGTDRERIREGLDELLSGGSMRERVSRARNPYGDGRASERIVAVLSSEFVTQRSPLLSGA
jgi:UDP-N-acetylglucosamine 2-epimerase (non-hydrolysing)